MRWVLILLRHTQIEVHMLARLVAGRTLESYRRPLGHALSGLDQRGREVSVQRVEAARVGDDHVVPVPAARASDQGHDAVVRRVDPGTAPLHPVAAGMGEGVLAVGRLAAGRAW